MSAAAEPGPPLIALEGLRKTYGGHGGAPAVEVLHGIDLTVRAGEFVAIVGSSGSGKSTLMHLLGCLDRPSAGRYLFAGRDVAQLDADALARLRREAFGFVFQGYHLIPTESAQENVEVPAVYAGTPGAERATRARALLARLGLAERLDHRPHQLSGGQQQRVSIARALMNGGRIVLADEPTGALDSASGREVMALFDELADAGHTVILITHDREVAQRARRVIELRDGRIVGDSGADAPAFQVESASGPRGTGASSYEFHSNESPDATRGAWREALRTAWRTMWLHRVRTALTLLGIVIGVASVIVMLAVGEGARQRVVAQLGTMGTTILYVSSRPPPTGGAASPITEDDLAALAALPEIRRVLPVIGDPITVRRGGADRSTYVFAASTEMPAVHRWAVARGRYFTSVEDRELAPLVVLGHKAAAHFFPDEPDPIGLQLLIGNSQFEVIGVMAERGADSGAQDYDDMVFIPYRAGRARVYQVQVQPDYVVIEARGTADVLPAEAAIRRTLAARHGGREDFGIGNAGARLQAEAETRRSMTLMLGLVAAVSLVVGGIGVMNVMLMAVRERTREIGIRMATGARRGDILRQFMVEAVLVTLTGGAVGVAIGLAVGGVLIALKVSIVFSLTAIAGAFACAVATGLVFGFMPARQAAALDPVVALSSE
ncbi:MAG: ABC transporter permease [Pseudomonadota bacterium]|nr:ABC transporter permease [Pseudomonadota bacterium]